MIAIALLALTLTIILDSAQGIYFHVVQGQDRCFIEEVPSETLIVVSYKNPDYQVDNNSRSGVTNLKLKITSPSNKRVVDQYLDRSGKVHLRTKEDGEHHICFTAPKNSWGGEAKKIRVDVDFSVGESGVDYSEVAKRESLSELEVEIRRLNDKLKDIQKEQAYQKSREEMFRATSESTHKRVQWFTLAQISVASLAAVAFVAHLKNFVSGKKNA